MRGYWFIIFALLFTSCYEELDLGIGDFDQKLVVDGTISQGQFPRITLTKTAPYFDAVDSASLRELVVTVAKVTVYEGDRYEVMTLYRNDDYYPPYYYQGNVIRGEVGKTYRLKVEYQGYEWTSVTSIPTPVYLDDLNYVLEDGEDTLGHFNVQITDDPLEENYYRLQTRILGKQVRFQAADIATFKDDLFSGETANFSLYREFNALQKTPSKYFFLGDTVEIQLLTMDEAQFLFWRSFDNEMINVGNPFASSMNNVITNIASDVPVLGNWGGYGATKVRIIAQ